MKAAREHRSGKGHKDENFPVASFVIEARHRGLILAFYEFVRIADDIADHATLSQDEKLAQLDRLEAELLGSGEGQPEALHLRKALAERGMSAQHPCDVLTAFRMDVTKLRYADWNELIHYCTYSAMPVGRFVLDVHEESKSTWTASDALCAALQIINHIQDCGKDYRNLGRVYIPSDAMTAAGMTIEMLGADRASPQMAAALRGLTTGAERLLNESLALAPEVANTRLALEIGVIQAYAAKIVDLLKTRDPLAQRVHLTKWEIMTSGLMSLTRGLCRRATRKLSMSEVSRA
ncbi:squalene synthase HpnC [Bradyrhizobium sp. LHD-71]|uniref:squalene synthase HpnC n=1 Tax=Bradyrhizobium sp. LHD-71 TaxID=3072141 RepID=UPI00280D5463|nr:squalene synthase HpnC [Bradyrhizobium sp. LHD-71]MDQ8727746.1 squalene synthase HpnC [Bradyrhizobium sp. LHD-71]